MPAAGRRPPAAGRGGKVTVREPPTQTVNVILDLVFGLFAPGETMIEQHDNEWVTARALDDDWLEAPPVGECDACALS